MRLQEACYPGRLSEDDGDANRMPVNSDGYWIPQLSERQIEIFNAYERYVLVSGPRKSAKTYGVSHRVIRHAWEAGPRCRIGVFTRTQKNALVGVFDTLYEVIAKEWCDNLDGCRIIKPHSTDGTTKMHY